MVLFRKKHLAAILLIKLATVISVQAVQRLCSDDETLCTVGLCNITSCSICTEHRAVCATTSSSEPIPQNLLSSTRHLRVEYNGQPVKLVEEMFANYPELYDIQLSGNILSIASETFQHTRLSSLEIKNTRISQLQLLLMKEPRSQLRYLSLSKNRLVEFPFDLFVRAKHLINLDLSYNPINICEGGINSTIGEGFRKLPSLQTLNLAGLGNSKCENIGPHFFDPLWQVTTLNLSESQLLQGDQTILSKLPRLQNLMINNIEPFRSCPAKANKLLHNLPINLRQLHANGWRSSEVTTRECELNETSFEGLDNHEVSGLYFASGDHFIGDTLRASTFKASRGHLDELDLGWTRIAYIEDGALAIMKRLSYLSLEGNQLGSGRFNLYPANTISNLKSLKLNYIGIRYESIDRYDVSHFFLTSPHLEELYLNGNFLNKLPNFRPNITTFPVTKSAMSKLTLDDNELTLLPEPQLSVMCGFMPELQIFSAERNGITNIAGICISLLRLFLNDNFLGACQSENFIAISKLKKLYTLELSRNGLTEIPEYLTDGMTNLSQIMLAGNEIKHIKSNSFKFNTLLKELDLSGNLIRSLDSFDPQFSSFEKIYFQDNLLQTVPFELTKTLNGLVPRLVMFDILGNPFDCSCGESQSNFRKWVASSQYIANIKNLTCSSDESHRIGNHVYNYTQDKFYCVYQTPVEISGSVFLAIILAMPIVIYLYKYRWYLKHPQIVSRAIARSLSQIEIEHSCQYDAIVSYDMKSEPVCLWLIEELIPEVEGCRDPERSNTSISCVEEQVLYK